jgi:hypothetical protein
VAYIGPSAARERAGPFLPNAEQLNRRYIVAVSYTSLFLAASRPQARPRARLAREKFSSSTIPLHVRTKAKATGEATKRGNRMLLVVINATLCVPNWMAFVGGCFAELSL